MHDIVVLSTFCDEIHGMILYMRSLPMHIMLVLMSKWWSMTWCEWSFLYTPCWWMKWIMFMCSLDRFTKYVWGYGASHVHCTSRLRLRLCVRSYNGLSELKLECAQIEYGLL